MRFEARYKFPLKDGTFSTSGFVPFESDSWEMALLIAELYRSDVRQEVLYSLTCTLQ